MPFNINAIQLGQTLGQNMSDTSAYKEDFIPTEELASISLVPIASVNITGSYYAYKNTIAGYFIFGHPVYGILGVTGYPIGMALVWGHPVYGIWGTGLWSSSSVYVSELVTSGVL
jgi:hypothetical protein